MTHAFSFFSAQPTQMNYYFSQKKSFLNIIISKKIHKKKQFILI